METHRALLVFAASDDPGAPYDPDTQVAAAANGTLPVFWCMAFARGDVRTVTATREADAVGDRGQGSPRVLTYPVLIAPLVEARRRAAWRRDLLYSILPRALEPLYDGWLALLDSADAKATPYLLTDLAGFAAALGPGDLDELVGAAMRAVSDDVLEDWDVLLAQAGINLEGASRRVSFEDDDPLTVAARLRGDRWVRPVPWGV